MDEVLIIMHRDVHFSGSFSAMIDYYSKEGIGALDEIDIEDLHHLKTLEEQNVPLTLGPEEKRRVLEAKTAYKKVQALYDNETTALMADLILEEEEKLEAFDEQHMAFLIDLLHDRAFSDPLFPGYGLAPVRAAKVLGRLQKEEGTRALFERLLHIGDEEIYLQEEILGALRYAKEFLLARLTARPPGHETVCAAMALGAADIDESLIKAAKNEHDRLVSEGCQNKELLAYLEALYTS